jgi:hypothetical protein
MRAPTVLTSDELTIYLNDHRAGSTLGLELVNRILSANRGTEFELALAELATEIAEDGKALERIFDRLAIPRDQLKRAGAWAAEKAGRVKLNGRLFGYSPLSRLLELEAISSGVHAKRHLWRALGTIAARDSRIEADDLEQLIARADSQLERLAGLQSRAAELALSG